MIKLYCRCGEQLEVIDSDDSMPRTMACPKCAKEYELSLTEIVKRNTHPTNKFYTFYHRYNKAIGVYLERNRNEAYVTNFLFVEAINEDEAKDIVENFCFGIDVYPIVWDGGELVTTEIDQYAEDYVHEFHYGYSACVIFRNGHVTWHIHERTTERK